MKKLCPNCKTIFPVKPSQMKRRRYCSTKCMADGYRGKPRQNVKPCYKRCSCGTRFRIRPSIVTLRKTCSIACAAKLKTKSGISLYRRLRKSKCERCGSNKKLLVHHRDRNRKNNAASNLETLCATCHNHEHEPRRKRV